MCVILVKPKKANIYRRTLKSCYDSNPDGAGFMFADNNKLQVLKGFKGFRDFYKTYRKTEYLYPESDFVIHMRIATSGYRNAENCHPFKVNDNLAFAHNGVFWGLGNIIFSDTHELNEIVFKKFPSNFLEINEIKNVVIDYVETSFSKVVFMDNTGRITIINEFAGIWDDGIWYSNKLHASDWCGYVSSNNTKDNGYGVNKDYHRDKIKCLTKEGLDNSYYCHYCHSYFKDEDVVTWHDEVMCPLCGNLLYDSGITCV